MRIYHFVILIVISLSWTLSAQQRIIEGKVISKNERWSGVVVITGDVKIAKTGRLVIDPGTRVLFQPKTDKTAGGRDKTKSEIIVEGVLIARGSNNNKIIFSSNSSSQRMGDWYGISISGGKQISIFNYVTIEYAFDGLRIKKSAPQINTSLFRYNYNTGIFADMRAKPKIIGNIISDNGYAGVICKLGAKPILSENIITGNQIGLLIDGSSQPNLGNMQKGADYNVGKNRLSGNHEYNLYNHGSKDIYAINNSWGSKLPEDVSASIFDNANDRKYGSVIYTPIMGSTTSDLNTFLGVSQETTTPRVSASSGVIAAAQPVVTNNPNLAQNVSQPATADNTDSIVSAGETTEQPVLKHRTIDEMLGTLAVAETPKEKAAPEPEVVNNMPEVDYNQVFMDVFLDEEKTILKREAPVITKFYVPGKVFINVVVNKDGTVAEAKILRGINDYIDDLSLEAAKNFVFKPGKVKNNLVRFSTNLLFQF